MSKARAAGVVVTSFSSFIVSPLSVKEQKDKPRGHWSFEDRLEHTVPSSNFTSQVEEVIQLWVDHLRNES